MFVAYNHAITTFSALVRGSLKCTYWVRNLFWKIVRKLECPTTRTVVRRPTSFSKPRMGASFILITHSAESMSLPADLPRSWPELVTREHVSQCSWNGWKKIERKVIIDISVITRPVIIWKKWTRGGQVLRLSLEWKDTGNWALIWFSFYLKYDYVYWHAQ